MNRRQTQVIMLLGFSCFFFVLAIITPTQTANQLFALSFFFLCFARAAWLILIRGVRLRQKN